MFETGSDRHVFCPASSAVCGKRSGDAERDSGLPQKVFGIAPESAFTIARIPYSGGSSCSSKPM
jgi:hypothetical protein